MDLNEHDQITYLANIIFVANADGTPSATKLAALDEIPASIGAKKMAYNAAKKRALSGKYLPTIIESFPAQVSNLADILYVSVIDGDLSESEKI